MSDLITKGGFAPFNANVPQKLQRPVVYPASVPNTKEILKKLWRQKLLIALVALLVVVPAAVITYRSKPLYSSSTLIQISPDSVQILPYRDIAASDTSVYYEMYMSTQDQFLRSPNLAGRVAAKLQSEPKGSELYREAAFLPQRFQIRRVPNTQFYQLTYHAPSPTTAATVVNTFATEYIKQQIEARQVTRDKATETLQKELEGLEQRLEASEKALISYAQRENIVNTAAGGDLVQKRLATADQQITDARNEVALAQTKLRTIQTASIQNMPEKLVTQVLGGLEQRYLQAEHDLASLRTNFGENWPAVVAKRDEIALIQEQLTRERKSSLTQATEQARLDLQAAQSRLQIASDAWSQEKDMFGRYSNASIEYNILRREVDTNQKLYEGVLERLSQTNLQRGFEFSNIQVVEPGEPNPQVENNNFYNLSLASLLGLTLGLGAATLRGFWDNSVSTLEEVQELTHLPGLGTVPSSKLINSNRAKRLPKREMAMSLRSAAGTTQAAPSSPEVSEAVRGICASILLSRSDFPPRVIAISSALPGEGKTTMVREIGRALADSGALTLVVEADLRKPSLAESFGLGQADGLSLFLSGHAATPRICETDQPNLYVAPAGPPPPNPVALLGSEKMASFLREMGTAFKFVLLDTPPLLALADARIIGSQVDGLVLVTRARSTSKNLIHRAWSILQSSGINVLGVVLNDADKSDLNSAYNYYKPN